MKCLFFVFLIAGMLISCASRNVMHNATIIKKYPSFKSEYVEPRNVEILLPSGYNPENKYDVLYVQDGQNVFNEQTAFSGIEWRLDETISRLMDIGKIRPIIVVASWCTKNRFYEYMPNKPINEVDKEMKNEGKSGKINSDKYLKFLVYELKPFVDNNFSTNRNREHTYIMGSSMGGLISCYAVCEYPDIFGGAACLSPHWPALNGVFLKYLRKDLPNPKNHKLYFDYGTETLDSLYEPFQKVVDHLMILRGYEDGNNWKTQRFEGARHNEKDWSKRVHIPLEFLLGSK